MLLKNSQNFEIFENLAPEKKVEFVDLVKRFPTHIGRKNRRRYSGERTVQSLGPKNGNRVYYIHSLVVTSPR